MSVSQGNTGRAIAAVVSDAASSANRLVKGDTTNTTNAELVVSLAADSAAPVLGVTTEATTAANTPTTIMAGGIAEVAVDGSGTAIDIGTSIIPTTAGVGIAAAAAGATAQHAIGYALAPSAASGDVIPVLIDRHIIVKGTA